MSPNPYKTFIMEAKINSAAGFGHPATNKNTPVKKQKKPTKEELGRWRARSDKFREDYLKKHPNSKYKDVPTRGSIVTRSKKISAKPWAKEMAEHGVQALQDLGLKGKKISFVTGKIAANSLHKFISATDRSSFADKAKTVFNNYRNKLKPEDQKALDKEADDINNSTQSPSRTILRRGGKGLIFGLVGLAAGAAMFSGIIPADVAMFLGVKVLDSAFEAVKHSTREPLSTLIAANTIHSFFRNKDSDEYAEDALDKMKRRGHTPDVDESTDPEDPDLHDNEADNKPSSANPETPEAKLKRIVQERLGPSFNADNYYLDDNGDLKRKKGSNNGATT